MNDYVQCTIPADMLPFMATALYELVVRILGPESNPTERITECLSGRAEAVKLVADWLIDLYAQWTQDAQEEAQP